MIERWSINKCALIRRMCDISGREIADKLYVTKQTISNAERGKLSNDAEKRMEILYTLALKDIIEERSIDLNDMLTKIND